MFLDVRLGVVVTKLIFTALTFNEMRAVRPKKNLGQHFLTDLNIAKAIADTVDACPDICADAVPYAEG